MSGRGRASGQAWRVCDRRRAHVRERVRSSSSASASGRVSGRVSGRHVSVRASVRDHAHVNHASGCVNGHGRASGHAVAMIVSTMPVIVAAVVVSVMGVPECEKAHHVDQKPKRAHDEQFLDTPQLPSFQHTLSGLPNELHTYQHEEDPVSESRKRVEFAPTIRHVRTGGPLGSNSCAKTNDKAQTIEEHVHSVAEKTKGTTQVAVQSLDKHECEIETAIALVGSSDGPVCLGKTYHVK